MSKVKTDLSHTDYLAIDLLIVNLQTPLHPPWIHEITEQVQVEKKGLHFTSEGFAPAQ